MVDIFGVLNYFGETLLYQIFLLLLSLGCMPYVICNVRLLVRFNSRFIQVVPMMRGHLIYYELLLVPQMGIMVCGWNLIIQICRYRLIGGEAFLIFLSYLGLLLPIIIEFTIVAYESLCLLCTVPLWSVFWRFVSLSLHCLIYDCLGGLPDTWCSLDSFSSLKL